MRAVIADLPRHWLEERKRSGAHRFDEFWDGVLHVPPVQTTGQQAIQLDLHIYLKANWAKPSGSRVRHQVNLTTPEDEARWTYNYRIPDIVLLTPDRFPIDKNEYMAGAPLVVIEIRSAGDESYEKLAFYAALGTPEAWVIDRDTKRPEVFELQPGGTYRLQPADPDGWVRSPATGVEMKAGSTGKLAIRLAGGAVAELPED